MLHDFTLNMIVLVLKTITFVFIYTYMELTSNFGSLANNLSIITIASLWKINCTCEFKLKENLH